MSDDFEGLNSKNSINLKKNKFYEDNNENIQKIIPIKISLTSILNNYKINLQGDFLLIRSSLPIQIKINNTNNQPIIMNDKDVLETTFNKLYLTTTSTINNNITLYIGISTKLNLAKKNIFSDYVDSGISSPFTYDFQELTFFEKITFTFYGNMFSQIYLYGDNPNYYIFKCPSGAGFSYYNISQYISDYNRILTINTPIEIKKLYVTYSGTIEYLKITGLKI